MSLTTPLGVVMQPDQEALMQVYTLPAQATSDMLSQAQSNGNRSQVFFTNNGLLGLTAIEPGQQVSGDEAGGLSFGSILRSVGQHVVSALPVALDIATKVIPLILAGATPQDPSEVYDITLTPTLGHPYKVLAPEVTLTVTPTTVAPRFVPVGPSAQGIASNDPGPPITSLERVVQKAVAELAAAALHRIVPQVSIATVQQFADLAAVTLTQIMPEVINRVVGSLNLTQPVAG